MNYEYGEVNLRCASYKLLVNLSSPDTSVSEPELTNMQSQSCHTNDSHQSFGFEGCFLLRAFLF